MGNVSFGNLTTSNYKQISPELQKRAASQENFGALDTEKLKQDTVEIAKNAQTQVEENFIFRTLRNVFGVKDPKKFLISTGLMIATTLGFAALGNKFNKQIIAASQKIDELPIFKNMGKTGEKVKKAIGNFMENHSWTKDIKETFAKRKAGPVQAMAKTVGPKGQFSYNVSDTVQAIHLKFQGDDFKSLKKGFNNRFGFSLRGKGKALEFLKSLKLNEISVSDFLANYQGKNLDEAQIQDLVKKYVDIEDSFGFFTKGSAKQAKLQPLIDQIKSLGIADDEMGDFLGRIQKMSDHQRTIKGLQAKLGEQEALELIEKLKTNNHNLEASIRKLVGENNPDLEYFYKNFMEIEPDADKGGFAQKLTQAIAQGQKVDSSDPKKLAQLLQDLNDGKLGDEFTQITMNREGFIQGWAPANGIDKLGSKIFKDKWKPFGKGNLGDALIKFNMADGTLATTAAGKLTQKIPLYLGESVSNHVADLSTMNLLITVPMLLDLFNTVQEAPKEQKSATLADNFVGGLGQFVISMPLASALTYGISTFKNLENNKNPLKWIGKLVGMGLPTITKNGTIAEKSFLKRFAGGAFRFWAIMFLLSPKISEGIQKVVHNFFGKPYDKEEAEKQRQLEEQKKQMIPELGITQGELMEKMEKNPQAMQRLQTDEKLAYTISQNPKAILDLLDGKEVQYIEPKPSPASQGVLISPANKNRLNNQTNAVSYNDSQATSTEKKERKKIVDTATYIPSSEFSATGSALSEQQLARYNEAMAKADRALRSAEKYI